MKKKRKNKYKSIITKRIVGSLHKIGMVFLVVIIFYSVVIMRGTNAGFLDEEKTSSAMTMGVLDAGIAYSEVFDVNGLVPGIDPAPAKNVTFSNTGTLNFKYGVKYLKTGGDSELCDALLLTAKKGDAKVYDKKPLKDFDMKKFGATDFSMAVSGSDKWNFIVELPEDAGNSLEKKICKFKFNFTAWQTINVDGSKGFTAGENFGENIIQTGEWESAGDVVINEIMWMGNDGDDGDEWIELRNMTGKSIDISGWSIIHGGEGKGGHIQIPDKYSIKPNGYFLITKEKWDETAIKLDDDLEKNEGYTHVAGMSLLQSGEDLILQNKNRINIDTAWKADTSSWPYGCNNKSSTCPGIYQSMERNNESQGGPGDGTLADSWHTCTAGGCNDGTYWKTAEGKNYGTPGMPNLSPVVMNEIAANPESDGEQWVELYNMLDEDFDVSGWYFENNNGDKIKISDDSTKSGKTTVPGKGMLVIKLGKNFLDKKTDKISFYDDMKTPDDEDDDICEDIFEYKESTKAEGDSFMRLPDGIGIWIDPEATPGEENKLEEKEEKNFRYLAYEECFDGEKIAKNKKADVCAPVFLEFLGMIKNADDKTIDDEILVSILEMKKEKEEKKLAEMLEDAKKLIADQEALAEALKPVSTTDEDEKMDLDGAGNSEKKETGTLPENKKEEDESDNNSTAKEEVIDNSIKEDNEEDI